jgi:type I restriction enzyme, S subunit
VAKKRRLRGLIEEKRAALISHAVTRGLDPTVPMKDSGIEWLGQVPAHWEVWKASHAFSLIGGGTTPKTEDRSYYDGDVPWVTTSELREHEIGDTGSKLSARALEDHPTLLLYPPGTLLIAMYGATIGRLGILTTSACTNQACCALAGSRNIESKFLFYWLRARRREIITLASGGGQPNINQDVLRSLRVPVPPIDEQREIISRLERESADLDGLSAKVRRHVELLREYRTALISAAVTGKIDVRAGHR